MLTPLGTRIDPFLERRFLGRGKFEIRFRRRHEIIRILCKNARDDFALCTFARNNDLLLGPLLHIQTELSFTRVSIGAVTGKTGVRKNRQNVPAKIRGGKHIAGDRQYRDGDPTSHRR